MTEAQRKLVEAAQYAVAEMQNVQIAPDVKASLQGAIAAVEAEEEQKGCDYAFSLEAQLAEARADKERAENDLCNESSKTNYYERQLRILRGLVETAYTIADEELLAYPQKGSFDPNRIWKALKALRAPPSEREMICCYDYEDNPGFPGHCISCHEDYNEYGYEMPTLSWSFNDAEYDAVCCTVAAWLEKLAVRNEERNGSKEPNND